MSDLVPIVDREAILRTLNLNPSDPKTQALLLICDRYGLDPLLKHVVLIEGRPYVTRDGYLAVAHRSEQLDGIEVLEEGEDDEGWWARVSVFRKDMSHPFTYRGRYPAGGSNKRYGPEMAMKCAEVMALRRAFNVTGIGAADEKWDSDVEVAHPPPPSDDQLEQVKAHRKTLAELDPDDQARVEARAAWEKELGRDTRYNPSTHDEATRLLNALDALLGGPDGEPWEDGDGEESDEGVMA